MTHALIAQAVFDEAGDTGTGADSSRYLIVAGVICEDIRPLRRLVEHTRRVMGKRARKLPEIKARDAARGMPRLIPHILTRMAAMEIEIYAAILDKRHAARATDMEEWYRTLYAQCVNQVLQGRSRLQAFIDRRYTKSALNRALIESIAQTQPAGTTLTLVTEDSQSEPALQTVDLVAWSLFQKYEHQTQDFYYLIAPRVVEEVVLTHGRGS